MRRIALGLATAAAVLIAAGTLVVSGRDPAPAGAAQAARRIGQRTLVLGPGSGFAVSQYATDPSGQQLLVADEHGDAEVRAYEPGRFDVASVRGGQRIRLAGHDALYLRTPPAVLAWRSIGGAWLMVTSGVHQEALFRLARAVRLDPPTPVAGPVGLRWLPSGVTLSEARIGSGSSALILTGRGRRSYDIRLSTYAVGSNEWTNGTLGLGLSRLRVAGHPAWYSESSPDDSQLLVEAGTCGLRLQVSDRARVPLASLVRLLTGAVIGGCADPAGWTPILP
jgi:hypothetical protein